MKVVLSLGSNQHPRHQYVSEAIKAIEKACSHCACSSLYETPELHGKGSSYINAVAEITTNISIETLNAFLKEYERKSGRDKIARCEGRVPIDIDIVLVDNQILRPRDYYCDFFQIGYLELLGSKE